MFSGSDCTLVGYFLSDRIIETIIGADNLTYNYFCNIPLNNYVFNNRFVTACNATIGNMVTGFINMGRLTFSSTATNYQQGSILNSCVLYSPVNLELSNACIVKIFHSFRIETCPYIIPEYLSGFLSTSSFVVLATGMLYHITKVAMHCAQPPDTQYGPYRLPIPSLTHLSARAVAKQPDYVRFFRRGDPANPILDEIEKALEYERETIEAENDNSIFKKIYRYYFS